VSTVHTISLRHTSVDRAFAQAISPPASHIGWSCWVPGQFVCVCVCGLWWTQWNWNWLLCE